MTNHSLLIMCVYACMLFLASLSFSRSCTFRIRGGELGEVEGRESGIFVKRNIILGLTPYRDLGFGVALNDFFQETLQVIQVTES